MAEHAQAGGRRSDDSDSRSRPRSRRVGRSWDLWAPCAVALLGALGVALFGAGSAARIVFALPVLFFIPGHLLVEALVGPAAPGQSRSGRALVAIGVSPALVGLLSLATALLPGGFGAASIVVLVTVGCLCFGAVALLRRRTASAEAGHPTAATA